MDARGGNACNRDREADHDRVAAGRDPQSVRIPLGSRARGTASVGSAPVAGGRPNLARCDPVSPRRAEGRGRALRRPRGVTARAPRRATSSPEGLRPPPVTRLAWETLTTREFVRLLVSGPSLRRAPRGTAPVFVLPGFRAHDISTFP